MSQRNILIAAIVVIVLIVGYLVMGSGGSENTETPAAEGTG